MSKRAEVMERLSIRIHDALANPRDHDLNDQKIIAASAVLLGDDDDDVVAARHIFGDDETIILVPTAAQREKDKQETGYAYSYEVNDNADEATPLLSCPDCGHDLTMWDVIDKGLRTYSIRTYGVMVYFVDHDEVWSHPSHLGKTGRLYDVDLAIFSGQHNVTECGGCGGRLMDLGVERQMRVDRSDAEGFNEDSD